MKIALDNTDCFNSQPPEGGWRTVRAAAEVFADVSTHSRPKAAGFTPAAGRGIKAVSTHSRPKAAGCLPNLFIIQKLAFQLTAARRRLDKPDDNPDDKPQVSTHSRPKAAGY